MACTTVERYTIVAVGIDKVVGNLLCVVIYLDAITVGVDGITPDLGTDSGKVYPCAGIIIYPVILYHRIMANTHPVIVAIDDIRHSTAAGKRYPHVINP